MQFHNTLLNKLKLKYENKTIFTLSPVIDRVSAPFNHRTSGRGHPLTKHSTITDSPSFTTLPRGSRTKYGSENSLPTAKLVLNFL